MMFDFVRWCRNYLRLCVFFIAALVGLQAPGFKDDYGHALRSAVTQTHASMRPFIDDAERFFGGSLDNLLAHYQNSNDPVYAKGGENLGLLLERKENLDSALLDYNEHPYFHLVTSPVLPISEQVWRNYTPQIQLNSEALISSLVFALVVSWVVEALFLLLIVALKRLFSRVFTKKAPQ